MPYIDLIFHSQCILYYNIINIYCCLEYTTLQSREARVFASWFILRWTRRGVRQKLRWHQKPCERSVAYVCADVRSFAPWISIIGDASNYRIPERMQIGTSLLLPLPASLYPPPASFLSCILSFSQAQTVSLATKRMCAWRIKRETEWERWKGRGAQRKGEGRETERKWKCVDAGERWWEAKVDSGKIGKRGLKNLLRDGNTSTDTTTFESQNEDGV